ncbi:hypothetical protein ABIE26_000161 [Pedobacter africanus]|uniref:Uncharacterized protein n=1 Tax=Pedobacter africanus TaxID=151894 RepID=A0ACC6KVS9_9SPHI|nr:hypothetical protein [Pedobacter africanus]MDR6783351.1 hypothetical protein [Pedobacter africanus]
MEQRQTVNWEVRLEENIPLTADEINEMERGHKAMLRMIALTIALGMVFMGVIAVFSVKKETLDGLDYEDYFAFLCVGLSFFCFCYLMAWLCIQYFKYNWRKDKSSGKNRLSTVVVDRDKTEHAEYLTFEGPAHKIRIEVDLEDYQRYPVGSKVLVTYLKFSKKALNIKTWV